MWGPFNARFAFHNFCRPDVPSQRPLQIYYKYLKDILAVTFRRASIRNSGDDTDIDLYSAQGNIDLPSPQHSLFRRPMLIAMKHPRDDMEVPTEMMLEIN